jgi:hypothetical protein
MELRLFHVVDAIGRATVITASYTLSPSFRPRGGELPHISVYSGESGALEAHSWPDSEE